MSWVWRKGYQVLFSLQGGSVLQPGLSKGTVEVFAQESLQFSESVEMVCAWLGVDLGGKWAIGLC